MTSFAREVLSALPDTNLATSTNNYSSLQEFTATPTRRAAASTFRPARRCRSSAATDSAISTTDDQPNIPLPSGGGGNGHIYARNRQFVLGTHLGADDDVAARGPVRLVVDRGGQESAGARDAPARSTQFGLPGLPTDSRIAGGLPTQIITGFSDLGRQATNPAVAVSDRLQPEGELHLDDERAFVQERLRVPAHRYRRCRT